MALFLSCSDNDSSTNNNNSTTVVDIDGNSYNYVDIGIQRWTKENLNVTRYSDKTVIPQVTDPAAWAGLTTGAWCYYNNDTANGIAYGKLYNWYAITGIYDAASLADPSKRKQLAPTGWHIPTDTEWTDLITFLGGESLAGGKIKAVSGWYNGGNGTNSSGFTGLPGGWRNNEGTFFYIGYGGFWWSSSQSGPAYASFRFMYYGEDIVFGSTANLEVGYSVRCLRD